MPVPQRIEADVLAILKRVSARPIEPALESELMGDLGFDSLKILELIAELEDHFDVAFPADTPPIRTVAQACEYLGKLVKQRDAQ